MLSALFLLAVLLLVLVNGFFVAAEFALVRARPAKLEEMARARKRGAQRAVDQAGDVTNYLSSCQFGITLASLGIGFLGEPAIASLLEPEVRQMTWSCRRPVHAGTGFRTCGACKPCRARADISAALGIPL